MKPQDIIRESLGMAHHIVTAYISDFNDTELMERSVPGANHTAWQLGHLIVSEYEMMEEIKPGFSPKLPAGFTEAYTKETSKIDDPAKFQTKTQYLDLYKRQRDATLQILEEIAAEDLDQPAPESMRSYAPTVGSVMLMQANHELMHCGQFVAVRRKLKKPVLM